MRIVNDIVMRQRRSLWCPGRAARKLDVNRVIEIQTGRPVAQLFDMFIVCESDDIVKVEHAGCLVSPKPNDESQVGQSLCMQLTRDGGREFWRKRLKYCQIVTAFERCLCD